MPNNSTSVKCWRACNTSCKHSIWSFCNFKVCIKISTAHLRSSAVYSGPIDSLVLPVLNRPKEAIIVQSLVNLAATVVHGHRVHLPTAQRPRLASIRRAFRGSGPVKTSNRDVSLRKRKEDARSESYCKQGVPGLCSALERQHQTKYSLKNIAETLNARYESFSCSGIRETVGFETAPLPNCESPNLTVHLHTRYFRKLVSCLVRVNMTL